MAVPQEPAAAQLQALANPAPPPPVPAVDPAPPAAAPQPADGAEANEQVQLNEVFAKCSAFSLLLASYPVFMSSFVYLALVIWLHLRTPVSSINYIRRFTIFARRSSSTFAVRRL